MSRPLLLALPWAGPGLKGFTSTRVGGVSQGAYDSLNLGFNTQDDPRHVLANRRLAFEAGGLDLQHSVFLQQVHGDEIAEAQHQHGGRGSQAWGEGLEACDAVFTRQRGLALAIGHADCLAVAIADPVAGLLGLAHAGWRGALAGLPAKLARRLLSEGAQPARMQAVLSPCLGPRQLQLSELEHRQFSKAFAKPQQFCSQLKDGHFYLDLWSCARQQLAQAGVPPERIQGQELDTGELPELFFSHRRDQGLTGRMLTVASLS